MAAAQQYARNIFSDELSHMNSQEAKNQLLALHSNQSSTNPNQRESPLDNIMNHL